jgi:predicted O-methyltransferase YrrM
VLLLWLSRSGPGSGKIVEIGSFRGRSTLCLAVGVRGHRSTRVVSVDPHVYETEGELRENLAHFGMSGVVDLIISPSVEAARHWQGMARLVFVDGNHEEASAAADVEAWLPFLEPGGFLVIHDSTEISHFPGPREVARARLRVGPWFDVVGELGSITWARRAGADEPWLPPACGGVVLDRYLRFVSRRGERMHG